MIFYHEGRPGEVSHEAAQRKIADILGNPFTYGGLLARLSDHPWMRQRKSLCAPGAMASYLESAALREMTQGEGGQSFGWRARRHYQSFTEHTAAMLETVTRA